MRLFVILMALCFIVPVAQADYDEDSDCPGNSCDNPGNGPPGGDATAISEAQAFAIATAIAKAFSSSAAHAGASADNRLTFEGDDGDRYPGTSASVYATRCGGGASVSYPGGAAATTANDKFCNRLALATFYATVLGDTVTAKAIVVDAEDRMKRSGRFFGISRFLHLDEIPLVGPLFFGN